MVVTNGAGRVAEVGARFTLDAMPGKQMAIDADLNAGLISDEQARTRRSEISQEADFYGAMDGASKFVKGDAMAAVIITAINLVGGIIVGMAQHNLGFGEASQHYSLLTVGDGLAAQIPALLISVATGIIVTRAASDRDLGSDIANQILSQRKAPLVAAAAIGGFALIPGLPKLPFLFIGGIFGAIAWGVRNGMPGVKEKLTAAAAPLLPAPGEEPIGEVGIDALELAIGFGLVPLVEGGGGSSSLLRRVSMIRRQIAGELGIVIPPVRIHDELGMESHEYVLKVRGSEVTRGRIMPGHLLAMDPGDASGTLQGIPTREPAFGLEAVWVHESAHAEAESLGYTVVDAESVIVTHLTETIRGARRGAAHAPGRAGAARPAQGDERGRCRRGRARGAVARRDPASAAIAFGRGRCNSRSRARSWRQSATRREQHVTPASYRSTLARHSAGRSRLPTWMSTCACKR